VSVDRALLARGQDPARDVLPRRRRTLEIDADSGLARRSDQRRGARALVADRANPTRGEDRRAAIVGEDRRGREAGRELGERRVERAAAGDELAATNGRQRGGERLLRRRERGERGVDGVVGQIDDRADAVRRLEPLDRFRASQGACSAVA